MQVPLRARRGERNEVAEVGAGRLRELGGRWNNVARQLFWHFFDIADIAEFSACATEG